MAATQALQKGTEAIQLSLMLTNMDINIILMDQPSPRDLLALLNLSLDTELVDDIMEIVNQPHRLGLTHPLDPLTIYAIACIVAESKRLPAVDSHSLVMGGLPTERFLVQVQHENRLRLIWRIDELSKRWPQCLGQLSTRVETIRRGFVRFLQVRQAFGKLTTEFHEPFQLVLNHFKLLWLAYVQIKQDSDNYNNQQGHTPLLQGLLRCFFSGYLYNILPESINFILSTVFLQESKTELFLHSYSTHELDLIFLKVIGLRQAKQDHETLVHYLSDINFTSRMVDDMKKNILINHKQLGFQQIDQTIFLDMDYTLSPNTYVRFSTIRVRPYFDDCHSVMEAEQPAEDDLSSQGKKQQPQTGKRSQGAIEERYNHKYATLNSAGKEQTKEHNQNIQVEVSRSKKILSSRCRMQALRWIQLAIISKQSGAQAKFYRLYANLFGEQFDQFRNKYSRLARKVINKYSPQCLDVQARCRKTIDLFIGMVNRIMSIKSQQELKIILKKPSELASFLCIATILVNYIYKSPQPYSFDIIETFGLDAKQAFIPINWVGKHFNLLSCLREYLRAVEGQLLLVDLWRNQAGFTLLKRLYQKKVTYLDKAIQQRLAKHINWKVYVISDRDTNLEENIKSIVYWVMQHRPILLRYNTINLIILAAYVLSLQGILHQSTLQVIAKWKEAQQYFQEDILPKDLNGAALSFEGFLQQIFRKELDSMLKQKIKDRISVCNGSPVLVRLPYKAKHFRMGEQSPFTRPVGIMTKDYRQVQDYHKSSIVERINFDCSSAEEHQ